MNTLASAPGPVQALVLMARVLRDAVRAGRADPRPAGVEVQTVRRYRAEQRRNASYAAEDPLNGTVLPAMDIVLPDVNASANAGLAT